MYITDLEKLNIKIADLCGRHSPKHRIVIYALDKNYLSDPEFQGIKNAKFLENQLLQLPWVMALFWARLFYEVGDGNNYRKIMQESLGILRPDELFERIHSTCGWFPKDEILTKPTYRFQVECWLTGNEGDTSNLWKALPRFVRQALPGKSNEEICQLDGIDEDDITPPILWLLNKRDADFCRVLKWLNVGSSQEPLGNIFAKNPINEKSRNRDDFNASLGVLIAANGPRIAIKVSGIWFGNNNREHIHDLSVNQLNRCLFNSSISKSTTNLFLDDGVLGSSFNSQESFEIALGNNSQISGSDFKSLPWQHDRLLLFKNFGGTFCKFVENGTHTQGRVFYLAGRPAESNPPQLLLGDAIISNSEYLGEIRHAGITRSFFKYDLGELREDASALMEASNIELLAYIGRKPFLSICGGSRSDCQIPGEEYVFVFEGVKEVHIQSSNFIDDELSWEIHDSEGSKDNPPEIVNHSEDGHRITITIGEKSYGKKWSLFARSQDGGECATMTLVFLPSFEDRGVKWTPAQVSKDAHFSHATNTGFEFGTIEFPCGSIQVNRPLIAPLWGWRQGWGGVLCEYNQKKQFLNHKTCASWQLEVALPASGNWRLKFNNEVLENQRTITIQHLIGEQIGPQELQGENLGAKDLIQFVNEGNPAENLKVATIHRLPAHPIVGMLDAVPKIYIPNEFQNNHCRLFLFRESGLLDDKIHEIKLDNLHAAGMHQIDGLPELKDQEGAWLILAETSLFPGLPLESVMLLGSTLSYFDIYGVCAIAAEGEAQTFSELLKAWIGEDEEFTEKKRSEIRSRLDILQEVFREVKAEHGVDKILLRARSRRETLGYGSHSELQNYFDSQYGKTLIGNNESIAPLLNLLLQCGFNWLAEPGWIESLHESAIKFLPPGKRFTLRMKNLIKQACPLLEAFELTHKGACSGIPNIEESFFVHPHNQAEIGLMVASPNSAVPAYKTGFFFRGVVPGGMKLDRLNAAPRRIDFPCDYRKPVELMDTRGDYCPIILKVTDSLKAARYFEDRIAGDRLLPLNEGFKNRIKDLFIDSLKSAAPLLGNFDNPMPNVTQLGVLLKACNDHFEKISEETIGQESRAMIFQAAVLCRLHAWIANSNHAANWTLNSPTTYDCICSLVASIWKCPAHREALIKDIAPIEWLTTWFKSHKFNN